MPSRHDLEERAAALGIELEYYDIWGRLHRVGEAALARLVAARRAPRPHGAARADPDTVSRAWTAPAWSGGQRCWGYSIQLYSLRSERNWGIGDLTDLAAFCAEAGRLGASLVGINPLHALRVDDPGRCSPYAPSNRLYIHPVWIDVEAVPEFRHDAAARERVASEPFRQRLAALRAREFVDYAGVLAAKLDVLRLLYQAFRERGPDGDRHDPAAALRHAEFERYRIAQGRDLRCHARHDAIQSTLRRADPSVSDWSHWPAALRDPDASAVAEWAEMHRDQVGFHEWLQWIAAAQLEAAQQAALGAGLAVGLYRDLALGVEPGGSEAWANQHAFAFGVSSGAPPDDLNVVGQCWGLLPFDPDALAADIGPLRRVLDSNMRSAGLLRIDHVMMLARLFWIPLGMAATEGAYVRYPLERLLGTVCAASQAARCAVLGEDLGTVPDALREALAGADVLGYRLLYFERESATRLRPVTGWPARSVAAVGTHDLPPLAGWWLGSDLDWRDRLGLWPAGDLRDRVRWDRGEARYALARALGEAGLLPSGQSPETLASAEPSVDVIQAVHGLLARSASVVLLVQPEDVLGLTEANNIPGTVDEHPNWRRKLPLTVERLFADRRMTAVAALCAAAGR